MKIFYILLSILISNLVIVAQVTMTYENTFVEIGTTITANMVDSSTLTSGTSGPNQTWDYSGLVSSSVVSSTVESPSATPYASYFPNATMAGSSISGQAYSYSELSSTGSYTHGIGADNGFSSSVTVYTDPEQTIPFPFTYNSTSSDNFEAVSYDGLGNIFLTRTGSNSIVGDGYGTLKLPDATYENVLRLKLTQSYTDVRKNGDYILSTTDYESECYYWYLPGNATSLLSIMSISMSMDDYPLGSTKMIMYLDNSSVNINDLLSDKDDNIKITQQSSEVLYISLGDDVDYDTEVSIYDITGKLLISKNNEGNSSVTFDIGSYTKGLHVIYVRTNDAIFSKKVFFK